MKRTLIPGLMLLAAFTLTNCSEQLAPPVQEDDVIVEETPSTEATEEEILGIPFEVYANASDEEVDTKTSNDSGGNYTAWEATDAIYVYHAPAGSTSGFTKNHKFSMRDIEENLFGGALESNTVLQSNQSYDWYFIYPNKEEGLGSASTGNPKVSTTVVIGAEKGPDDKYVQKVKDINQKTAGIYYPMYGKATTSGEQNPKVKMKHLSSLIALKVVNQGDSPKEDLTSNRDGKEKKIVIKELTFSVPSVTATGSDGKSGTQTSLPIVGAFTVDITGNPVYTEIKDESSHTITLKLPRDIEIDPGADATFYLAVRPFTADSIKRSANLPDPILEVTINGSKRQVTIPAGKANFEAGKVTTLRVPVKLDHTKSSEDTKQFLSFSNVEAPTLSVNGENVSAYKVGTKNNQGSMTITGNVAELMNALPAGFYVSYYEGQNTAMTVTNLDLNIKNDNGGYIHFTDYPGLEEAITGQLQQEDDKVTFTLNLGFWQREFDATDTAVKIVMDALETGIPRDASTEILNLKPIGLTEFIAPSTITFTKIVSNGASEGKDILFLDESPIHKQIGSDAINNLFATKFPGATYEGLIDISNGRNTPSAITTSEVLYSVLNEQFSYEANNKLRTVYVSKEIEALGQKVTIKAYIELKAIMDVFIKDAASLRSLLPKLKISLTIGTYPYSANPEDYGTKRAPNQPNTDYYPLIFWGLDAYGN